MNSISIVWRCSEAAAEEHTSFTLDSISVLYSELVDLSDSVGLFGKFGIFFLFDKVVSAGLFLKL